MDDADLTRPLLQDDRCSSEITSDPSFLQKLAQIFNSILKWLTSFVLLKRQFKLKPAAASRLSSYKQRSAVLYQSDNEEHNEYLRRLWVAAWPDLPFPEGIKSSQWYVKTIFDNCLPSTVLFIKAI